ncbi:alpha/beta fold hydrolase [Cohnella nanjingensis]|uniref:Alpha/beta fold hydrolase n=1 Tax=Cohnella nanjingensis TaxID=1387779 RepID=A0A7X0VE69_9BACL|nr:alpha/beta hydrolase [Cohnella nanjingensis]MBB6670690.1 alpha/beta fold hydrolase [Cohnella nanjingensis]
MPFARTNGIRLHYTEKGEGEPLVLLMGLGADGSAWEENARAYEPHFRCIRIDNRGTGESDKPEGPYTTKMMAADALGLLDALGIRRAHFSGISMGGAIAQEVALAAPERMLSLTLNCSWASCDVYTRAIFETLAAGYAALAADEFQKLLQLIIYTPAYHEHHDDLLEAARRQASSSASPMPAHAFRAQCDACVSHRTQGRLGAIGVPTLITAGDRDIFTPLALSQAIAEEIGHAELAVFEGSGHTHHWDRLDDFNNRTLAFLLRHKEGSSR